MVPSSPVSQSMTFPFNEFKWHQKRGYEKEFKILHLALNGNAMSSGDDIPTLSLRYSDNSLQGSEDFVKAKVLCQEISDLCKDDRGNTNGSIECVFLNSCKSSHIASRLKEIHNVFWIVYWETLVPVHDKAAKDFSSAFDHFLSSNDQSNYTNFLEAYCKAQHCLVLRGCWAICDPQKEESL